MAITRFAQRATVQAANRSLRLRAACRSACISHASCTTAWGTTSSPCACLDLAQRVVNAGLKQTHVAGAQIAGEAEAVRASGEHAAREPAPDLMARAESGLRARARIHLRRELDASELPPRMPTRCCVARRRNNATLRHARRRTCGSNPVHRPPETTFVAAVTTVVCRRGAAGNGLTGMRGAHRGTGGSMQLQTGRSEGFTSSSNCRPGSQRAVIRLVVADDRP